MLKMLMLGAEQLRNIWTSNKPMKQREQWWRFRTFVWPPGQRRNNKLLLTGAPNQITLENMWPLLLWMRSSNTASPWGHWNKQSEREVITPILEGGRAGRIGGGGRLWFYSSGQPLETGKPLDNHSILIWQQLQLQSWKLIVERSFSPLLTASL